VDAVENSSYPVGGLDRCRHPNDLIRDASGRGEEEWIGAKGDDLLEMDDSARVGA
jgi:hypothetical protein